MSRYPACRLPRGTPEPVRYNHYIDKSGGPDACWPWTGSLIGPGIGPDKEKYGQFSYTGGRFVSAHRYGWVLHNGPIPRGMRVCHSCDWPRCQNPKHWFLGTARQNTHDGMRKGRIRKKLTAQEAAEIKAALHKLGRGRLPYGSKTELARKYDVSPRMIDVIRAGRSWRFAR